MGRRWALLAVLAALGLSLMAFCLAAGEGRMPGGTFVAGVSVEGLTRAETLTALEGAAEAYGETEILFYCGDRLAAAVRSREIGAAPDLEAAVDLALVEGGDVWPRVRIDCTALEELLPPAPQNARYDRERGQVAPGRAGVAVDAAALEEALTRAGPGGSVGFPVEIREPELGAEQLEAMLFRDELSAWETEVEGSRQRQDNVALSAAAISGAVILPGEVFDFNQAVGERTEERGYAPAPSLLDGETVDTVGGGICQTAGTLYMAALLADLEIVERSGHSRPSSYLPLGLDAAVSWNGKNLRIRNDTGYPIRVEAWMEEGRLRVRLTGTRLEEARVAMRPEEGEPLPYAVEERADPGLAPGERQLLRAGREGLTVRTWREVYDGEGNLLRSALEAETVYPAQTELWLVGEEPGPADAEE